MYKDLHNANSYIMPPVLTGVRYQAQIENTELFCIVLKCGNFSAQTYVLAYLAQLERFSEEIKRTKNIS